MKREELSQSVEPTVEIPTRILVELIERAFAPVMQLTTVAPAPFTGMTAMPAIGSEYQGGKFAGISLDGDRLVALVLLPGAAESISWKDAGEWAKKQGGVLPSRHDGIVLFTNLKSEFKDAWYWLDSQPAGESGSAWCQHFDDGGQGWGRVSDYSRARAVRRLPLQ